jgi:hypothetical protein
MLIVLFGSSSVMLSYWFNDMLNLSYAAVRPQRVTCSASCRTLHSSGLIFRARSDYPAHMVA